MSDWFVKRGTRIVGPLSQEKLKSYALKGELRPDDLVGKSKEGPFRRAGDSKKLFPEPVHDDEDYGFAALDSIDVNAGERVYESYGKEGAYDEDDYDDDDDEYYRTTRRGRDRSRSSRREPPYNGAITAAGIVMIVYNSMGVIFMAVSALAFMVGDPEPINNNFNHFELPDEFYIAQCFTALIVSALSLLSGVFMIQRKSRVFIIVMAIVNMLPFINCCCFTGMPISIWALVLLFMEDVAYQFD